MNAKKLMDAFQEIDAELIADAKALRESRERRGTMKQTWMRITAGITAATAAVSAVAVISARSQPDGLTEPAAASPVQQMLEQTGTMESKTRTVETVQQTEAPQYAKLMQEYYTALNGQPCEYDFTGLGQDYNAVYEFPDYTLTLKSVVGCDWILYYFYDIKPETDTTYSGFLRDHLDAGQLMALDGTQLNESFRLHSRHLMPGAGEELDSGVWHCVGLVVNDSDKPFFSGENGGTKLVVPVSINPNESQSQLRRFEPFEFSAKEFPLVPAQQPEVALNPDLPDDKYAVKSAEENMAYFRTLTETHPLTRCADTPFGKFYVSDLYTDGIAKNTGSSAPLEYMTINGRAASRDSLIRVRETVENGGTVCLFDQRLPE